MSVAEASRLRACFTAGCGRGLNFLVGVVASCWLSGSTPASGPNDRPVMSSEASTRATSTSLSPPPGSPPPSSDSATPSPNNPPPRASPPVTRHLAPGERAATLRRRRRPSTRRALAAADEGRDAVAGVRGVLRGQLHIGAIETLGVIDLPALLAGFAPRPPRRHHPAQPRRRLGTRQRGCRRSAGHRLHRRPHRPRQADSRLDRPRQPGPRRPASRPAGQAVHGQATTRERTARSWSTTSTAPRRWHIPSATAAAGS